MMRDHHSDIVCIDKLSAWARAKLAQELFRLNQRIFAGVEQEEFEHLVITPSARWTRIQVIRNSDGDAVGYCAVHLFDIVLSGRVYAVFRGQAGILRAYRGEGSTFAFGFREAIRYKLMHPLERVYFFCTPIHPSSFHLLSRRFHEIYPSHRKQTPPAILALMHKLADVFGERRVDSNDPDILQVGWITLDSADETAFWQANSNPDIQFFLKVNPGYRQGHGLLTLAPLTLGNLLSTVVALAKRKLFALLSLDNGRG
ncbi:MAG: hypothetical protein AABZ34_19920 [Nitrospirota bacterium]